MTRYLIKRLLLIIPIVIAVSFIVFSIMELMPGSPATIMMGTQASQDAIDELNKRLGYDMPFLLRFGKYLYDLVVHQDMGMSYVWGRPVFTDVISRLPVTVMISFNAMLVAALIGIPIGVMSAVKQYSAFDRTATVMSLFVSAIPSFWLAMLLIYLLTLVLGLLPSSGNDSWRCYIMPALSLGIPYAAMELRYTRSAMLETIRQDYVDTARSKGVPENRVIWKHALKNALLPIITITGNNFSGLIGGAIVTETIYAMSGLGSLMITAIKSQDVPVVCGSVIVLSTLYCLIILVIDLLHAFVDPRVKARYAKRN